MTNRQKNVLCGLIDAYGLDYALQENAGWMRSSKDPEFAQLLKEYKNIATEILVYVELEKWQNNGGMLDEDSDEDN